MGADPAEPGSWSEALLATEPVFRRAPSVLNTQPATLRREGASLVVGWDPARTLPLGDPTRRDLWLSLGAFVESVVVAGASAGLGVGVEWLDGGGYDLARLSESGSVTTAFTAEDVLARRCSRGRYVAPQVTLDELYGVARTAGLTGLGGLQAGAGGPIGGPALVDVPKVVAKKMVWAADHWSRGQRGLEAETNRWLRGDDDPRRGEDGVSQADLGLSRARAGVRRVATSAVGPVLSHVGALSLLGTPSRLVARAAVAALVAPVDNASTPAQVAELGRVLMRCWLAAGREGFAVHPLGAVLDCPLTEPALATALSIEVGRPVHADPPPIRVLSVFRIGRPALAPPESARRAVPVL